VPDGAGIHGNLNYCSTDCFSEKNLSGERVERFLLKLSGAGWSTPETPFGDRRELGGLFFYL